MICDVLSDFDAFFGKDSDCQQWPGNFAEIYNKPNVTLLEELYEYGSQNLALVHVVMQSPYVTKIKRDVAMTFTTFIANTGTTILALLQYNRFSSTFTQSDFTNCQFGILNFREFFNQSE